MTEENKKPHPLTPTPVDDYVDQQGRTVLLYGKPGAGKTSLIKGFKGKTLVVDTGDRGAKVLKGTKDVYVSKIRGIEDLNILAVNLLKDCPYDNIVLDTITQIRGDAQLSKSVVKEGSTLSVKKLSWDDWDNIKARIFNFFEDVRTLTEDGVNIILVAHEMSLADTDDAGNVISKIIPDVGFSNGKESNQLCAKVDTVARLMVSKEGQRMLFCQPNPRFEGKDRFGRERILPEYLLNEDTNEEKTQETNKETNND